MPHYNVDYVNTFIAIAEDSPVEHAVEPPVREGNPSVAARQFAMIAANPYALTSSDVIFSVHADRNGLEGDRDALRDDYFAVGRACFRASDLGKRYGWGIHANEEGRLALIAAGTPEYDEFRQRSDLVQTRAMRSSRKSG